MKIKNVLFALIYFIPIIGFSQSTDLVINEFSASNDSIQTDQDGEFDDWIELYNNSSSNIALDGYYLSDNQSNITKWSFPVGTIVNANDYLIVWADKDSLQTGLHTTFKLSSSGEAIYLSDPSSNVIDSVVFGNQYPDITYGRFPAGTGGFTYMNPTFSAENTNREVVIVSKPDVSDSLYRMNSIVEIDITMDPADWDIIRNQERNHDISFCPSAPYPSPFIYKSATVNINGHTLERVGVRKKGFLGSMHNKKPSLKIKFDEYVENQELFDLDRLTLNNAKDDVSFMRECLTYRLFREAGVVTPRCNHALVILNGEKLGIYSNIESVKKRFLARNFSDNGGNLYEGTLSDFRTEQLGSFEAKTNKDNSFKNDLLTIAMALELPDEQLEAKLSELIDMETYISFWATEILVNHIDGYNNTTNNFFVYFDPTTEKMEFMPWGVDWTLALAEKGNTSTIFTKAILPNRLYEIPAIRQKLLNRLEELLNTIWNEDELLAQVDELEELLTTNVSSGDLIHAKVETEGLRAFIKNRRTQIEEVLKKPTYPIWTNEIV